MHMLHDKGRVQASLRDCVRWVSDLEKLVEDHSGDQACRIYRLDGFRSGRRFDQLV